ncbi:MAG TPA: hypothetical protein PKG52_01025 [bacterium]|nr:hypothetical protein [bacterium]HPS28840.1 hypothetical protein [bacterium]
MGLIRGIAEAVMEKAKVEMKDYFIKFIEAEKEAKKESAAVDAPKQDTVQSVQKTDDESLPEKKEIFPLIEKEFVKILFKAKPELIAIPRELADIIQMLPIEEFACFVKLFIFVADQKKNFGYLGNNLKKKIGLDTFSPEKFDELIENLEAYGLINVEQVSDNQKTFILYIPFDENTMVISEMQKQEKPQNSQQKTAKKKTTSKESEKAEKKVETENPENDEIPGKMKSGMEDEELYKSYRTFVNLEIDKAKMRVGRSNFDKIYMEAVKYIDKKYGFKVLSDSEKFKEHLTSYYISAFDIKSFEEWKKSKG